MRTPKVPSYDPAIIARDLPAFEAAFETLTADVVMIQAQLANKNMEIDGQRVDGPTFHHWRRRAVFALSSKVVQKRALKTALHEARMLIHHRETPSHPWQAGDNPADLSRFCLNTAGVIKDLLLRIGTLETAVTVTEDFTDLLEVSRESLEELRQYVLSVAESDQVAS